MRVVALSDSHGARRALADAASLALGLGPVDAFVFLGDGTEDFDAVVPTLALRAPSARRICVRGNNDWHAIEPESELFRMGGITLFASHGHLFGVRRGREALCNAARALGATVALYGHTHTAAVERIGGVLALNPGAVCPREPGQPAFAELLIGADGALDAHICLWPKSGEQRASFNP